MRFLAKTAVLLILVTASAHAQDAEFFGSHKKPTPPPGSGPMLIQQADGDTSDIHQSVSVYMLPLAQPSLSGNLLVVAATWNTDTITGTLTDNLGSNVWVEGPIVKDTTTQTTGEAWYCANCNPGTRTFTLTLNSATTYVKMVAAEYAGIAPTSPLDASHGTFATTSTSLQPGSMTTTHNGDLVWQWAVCDSGCSTGSSGKFTSQAGFSLVAADTLGVDLQAVQSGVQAAAGAINPTITSPLSFAYISIGMAFETAVDGTIPSGIRILSMGHRSTSDETAASRVFQFPCRGTALALAFTSGAGSPTRNISAITDSNGNTWVQPSGSPFVDVADNDVVALWYSLGTVCNAGETLTLTMAGTNTGGNGENYMMHDMSGVESFDKLVTLGGDQTVTGPFTGVTITPATASGLILSNASIFYNNATGVSSTVGTAYYLPTVGTCGTGWSVSMHGDENNGWAALFNQSTSALTFSWNQDNCIETGVHSYATLAASFNGNGQPSPPAPSPSGLGWTDLTAQTQQAVCPPNSADYDFSSFCKGVVQAWGGGTADTMRNRLIFWGGGHVDYDGNELYSLNMAAQTLTRLNNPTDPPSPLCEPAYSDGNPSSRHTYGSLAYIANLDEMFAFSGYVACGTGEDKNDTWILNMSTLAWTNKTPASSPNAAISIAQYDPNTNLVFLWDNNDGFWSYNPSSNTYTQLNSTPTSTYSMGVLDPVRKQFVTFGNSQAQKISVASGSSYAVTNLTGTGCSVLMSAEAPGLAYDKILDRIVGWPNFGGVLYIYDEDSDSCTTETYTANEPPNSAHTGSPGTSNGTYGRFQYFPGLNEYGLINDWNIDAHTLVLTNANTDFALRCASTGVLECVTFDTTASITGNSGPSVPKIDTSGDTVPTIDNTTYASGGGSLLFTVPASAPDPNTSGSFNIDFSPTWVTQMDSLVNGNPTSKTTGCGGVPCGNELWIQWRQRFDTNMLQYFAGSQGWKQVIIGEGDISTINAYSCSQMEVVLQNSQQRNIPQMYHSCGEKLDQYDNLYTPTGTDDTKGSEYFSIQNVAGGYLACKYSENVAAASPPCIAYVANEWMTFQVHIIVGTWYPGGVAAGGGPPGTFVHDSTVQLYVAQEGLPSTLAIDYHPTTTGCDDTQVDITTCQGGYDLTNPSAFPTGTGSPSSMGITFAKYGKIWLLPYQTGKCTAGCAGEPAAHTWYDELIIGSKQIPDPKF